MGLILSEPLTAAMYDDRHVKPEQHAYRFMTFHEIAALKYGQRVPIILNSGRIGHVKINGAVKRWKRDPLRLSVPVKYGMRDTARFETSEALCRFIVLLPKETNHA